MTTEPFTETFTRLRPRLQALAGSLLNSQDDADDAVQEAFYRLWRKRTQGDGRKDPEPEGSAVRTVRNLCLDMLRRRSVRKAVSIDEPECPTEISADSDDDREIQQERAETLARVEKLMATVLNDRQREILLMRDRDGCEMEEIARRFDMTEANVRLILSRARKAIRNAYANIRQ